MRFCDREKEIAALKKFEEISQSSAQMTMLLGRRQVGKYAENSVGGYWDRRGENEIDRMKK